MSTYWPRVFGWYSSLDASPSSSTYELDDYDHDTSDGQGQPNLGRNDYYGALLFNSAAFLLPALYATLSKLWVANIDASLVATSDVFTYIGLIIEIVNSGLPRAAWMIIGDKSTRSTRDRIGLANTLVAFQAMLGFFMSGVFLAAADSLADLFIPLEARARSIQYVRLSAFSALSSTLEISVANCTRALDKPDIPLLISSVRFVVNIVLDMLLLSRFHVGNHTPSVNQQAIIRLTCDMTASAAGFVYYLYTTRKILHSDTVVGTPGTATPSLAALRILVPPGCFTLLQAFLVNGVYLWLVSGVVAVSLEYATAFGVFNTLRWGLVIVPVYALEATSLAFTGHAWGAFRSASVLGGRKRLANVRDVRAIALPAVTSTALAVCVQVLLSIMVAIVGSEKIALWLSGSEAVAAITAHMWQSIDVCYVFYAASTQMATITLATRPSWFFYQTLTSVGLFVLPWTIVCQALELTPDTAWSYHSIVLGGDLVFSFFVVLLFDAAWVHVLMEGKIRVPGFGFWRKFTRER